MSVLSTFFARRKHGDLQPVVGLLIFAVLGYIPISSGIFALKNDDIIYFLPYRYNISEIIRSGHLPLWSPYIYMGFPISGDMQSGAWNPLVWLISLTGRYDLNRLAFEIIVYLFLAGLGMYKLGRELRFSKIFAFTIGFSYMFCGFMVDSGQILSWVACASLLPFTYLYFMRLAASPGAGNAVKFALANLFLVMAGYPAFFIINIYLLLLAVIVLTVNLFSNKNFGIIKTVAPYFFLSAGLFVLTGMVMWCSFVEMLPFYNRGQGVSLADALDHSYQIWFALTAFTPFAHTWAIPAAPGDSGIIRNIYFGILLVPFAIYGAVLKRTVWSTLVLIVILFAIFSSMGQALPFRSFEYHYLPLMNSFRHPANFRVFVIIGLLLLAGKGLQQTYSGASAIIIQRILIILMIALAIFALAKAAYGPYHTGTQPILSALKDGKLFNQVLLGNSLFQLAFLIAGFAILRKKKYRLYCMLSCLNILLIAEPQIFYGMVSADTPWVINQHIKNSPAGFPANINDEQIDSYHHGKKTDRYGNFSGIGSFYLKRPAINRSFNNPTILASYSNYIADTSLLQETGQYPAVFFADSITHEGIVTKALRTTRNSAEIGMLSFGPNEISFSAKTNRSGFISVFQNNYPGWTASIDGKPAELLTLNHTFIGIGAPMGAHMYQLKFRPRWLYPGIICSMLGTFVCAWLLYRKKLVTASGTSYHNPYY